MNTYKQRQDFEPPRYPPLSPRPTNGTKIRIKVQVIGSPSQTQKIHIKVNPK